MSDSYSSRLIEESLIFILDKISNALLLNFNSFTIFIYHFGSVLNFNYKNIIKNIIILILILIYFDFNFNYKSSATFIFCILFLYFLWLFNHLKGRIWSNG